MQYRKENDGDAVPSGLTRLYWRLVSGAAAILLVGVVVFGLRRPTGIPVNVAPVRRADLVVPILCDGTLEPPPGGELHAPENALVGRVLVAEGQRVKAGDALVALDDPSLAARAREARSTALALAAEKARAEADVQDLRAAAETTRRAAEADARLLAEKAITREAAEASRLDAQQAARKLATAEAHLASLAGGRNARLPLAESLARELEARLASLVIRAPADGVAYGLPRRIGEAVMAGDAVANVTSPERLRLRARVDQPDLPRIAAGQRVIVTFDGLPEKEWRGTVAAVSPGLREMGGRSVGEVFAEVADTSGALPPNASVNVQIVVGERKGALLASRAALLRDGEKRFVYVLEGGRARRRDVAVGLMGLNEVEVTSGVADGALLILPGLPVTDGAKVARAGG